MGDGGGGLQMLTARRVASGGLILYRMMERSPSVATPIDESIDDERSRLYLVGNISM